ncbi:hypothetical protein F0562_003011 [Nyssa sinensis]|uniref:Uncharacterized protein n=1 Tax=Nyssa sinensis TaxID=561372 RepID=A0A5J5BW10_9ASTE|nr:hypothetical protein F0562_003011 [Nyssa sinensis]
MSIVALDNSRIEGSEYMRRMSCVPPPPGKEEREEGALDSSKSNSSSIGKNSDLSESGRSSADAEDSGDSEVQSSYKGPLNAMESLEEVLPIRRGISKFYDGKSKSFTTLAHASTCSSSIKDIVKPENAYTRKRRNLLTSRLVYGGGISKRVASSSQTRLAFVVARSENNTNLISTSPSSLVQFQSPSPSQSQPQLGQSHYNVNVSGRGNLSPSWRSFSLADLQECASVSVSVAVATTSTSTSASSITDNKSTP